MDYTKGEWMLEGNRIKVLDRGVVAICPNPQGAGVVEFKANAQLISAAPDLYEVLQRAFKDPPYVLSGEWYLPARDALAKAERH